MPAFSLGSSYIYVRKLLREAVEFTNEAYYKAFHETGLNMVNSENLPSTEHDFLRNSPVSTV